MPTFRLQHLLTSLALVLAVADPASAQCAVPAVSVDLLPGCSVTDAPALAINPPVIGSSVLIAVDSIFPNAHGGLAVSFPPAQPMMAGPCNVFVDAGNLLATFEFFTDSEGDWLLELPLPNDPGGVGLVLHLQASVWALGGPLGTGDFLTNGARLRIGCDEAEGVGCTPGFWKQRHHFENWPAPYLPTTLFSDVFDDAFPGETLHDVLNRGGGGVNALGRHLVAGLLNAAAHGSSYGLTTSQLVTLFNGVFPGAPGAYEDLKDMIEAFNTDGCPF